jgi:hypothetical protein
MDTITTTRVENDPTSFRVLPCQSGVGLSEILSFRVGCWTPPLHIVVANDGTPHAA